MPKENTKPKQKRKKPKLKKVEKITKSKQLASKITKKQHARRSSNNSINNTPKPNLCCNGKPMPSLAELERMFEDSDDEEVKSYAKKTVKQSVPQTQAENIDLSKPVPISPRKIKELTNQILDYVTNVDPITILFDVDVPPPPVIPLKKRKKPEQPYIVGCKERPQVCGRSNAVVGAGHGHYGITPEEAANPDEEDCPDPNNVSVQRCSKSIFNPLATDIANMWKNFERIESAMGCCSNDKSKTENYECNTTSSKQCREFSPIPSTSTDSDTISKNDLKFNESLRALRDTDKDTFLDTEAENQHIQKDDSNCNKKETDQIDTKLGSTKNYVQVIEAVNTKKGSLKNYAEDIETQNINKESPKNDGYNLESSCEAINTDIISHDNDIQIIDTPCETIVIDDDYTPRNHISISLDDPDIEEVKPCSKANKEIPTDDIYASIIDIDDTCTADDCEIIDVDELISQNEALIKKFKEDDAKQAVTIVEPAGKQLKTDSVICLDDTDMNPATKIENMVSDFFKSTNSEVVDLCRPNIEAQSNTVNKNMEPPSLLGILSKCVQSLASAFGAVTPIANRSRNSHQNNTGLISNPSTNVLSPNIQFPSQNTSTPLTVNAHHASTSANSSVILMNSTNSVSNLTGNQPTKPARRGRKRKNIDMTSQQALTPQVSVSNATPPSDKPSKGIGDCPICLDSLSVLPIASTVCGHIFCMNCIKTAVRTSKRCPTCRKPLKTNGYHQLFL